MHSMISVIDSSTGSATSEEMAEIDSFNAALWLEGQLVFAGGLAAPDEAQIVDGREVEGRGPVADVTDGPLHGGHEHLSGFWLVKLDDAELAQPIAAAASRACNRRVELRPLL